jgi:DNA-binding Lrp family transcriptional regulator
MPEPWAKLPAEAARLSEKFPQTLRTLIGLALLADFSTGICSATQAQIAKRAGVKRRKVTGYLERLEEAGLIRVQWGRRRGDGHFDTLRYQIVLGDRYARVPAEVLRLDVTAVQLRFAIALGVLTNIHGTVTWRVGRVRAEADRPHQIAALAGLDERVVLRTMSEFVAAGYLTRMPLEVTNDHDGMTWESRDLETVEWAIYEIPPPKTLLPMKRRQTAGSRSVLEAAERLSIKIKGADEAVEKELPEDPSVSTGGTRSSDHGGDTDCVYGGDTDCVYGGDNSSNPGSTARSSHPRETHMGEPSSRPSVEKWTEEVGKRLDREDELALMLGEDRPAFDRLYDGWIAARRSGADTLAEFEAGMISRIDAWSFFERPEEAAQPKPNPVGDPFGDGFTTACARRLDDDGLMALHAMLFRSPKELANLRHEWEQAAKRGDTSRRRFEATIPITVKSWARREFGNGRPTMPEWMASGRAAA